MVCLPLGDVLACVMQVVGEVMDALGLAFEVRISHRVLLEAVLSHVKLPKELQSSALALLSTAASQSPAVGAARGTLWQSIRFASLLCVSVAGSFPTYSKCVATSNQWKALSSEV